MEEKLIESVRSKELLYNSKCKEYKYANLKQEAWEQIGAELNITATECKTKWNLLRNAFIHAITRRKTVTGQGAKNFKKWKFEDEMAFLLPFMAQRNTIAADVGEFSSENTDSSISEAIIEESSNENHTKPKKRKIENYHENILNIMKERSRKRPEKNDIDLFFESISETVKKFPRLEQVKLKFNIMKMVHEVDMRMCLESDRFSASPGTSTPSPPPFYHQTFNTQYSPSPDTQKSSSPHFVPQSSPSPQQTLNTNFSASPTNSPLFSSTHFVPQSFPPPQISNPSPSPPVIQFSSSQLEPLSLPSPQIAYHTSPPPDIQQFSPPYPNIIYQLPLPSTSQVSRSLLKSYIQDTVPENPDQPTINTSVHSQDTRKCFKGPAKDVIKEFLIIKKKSEFNKSLNKKL